jgi:hypothetical protein
MNRMQTSWPLCAGALLMLFFSSPLYATYEKVDFLVFLMNTIITFTIAPRGFFIGWVIPKKNYK